MSVTDDLAYSDEDDLLDVGDDLGEDNLDATLSEEDVEAAIEQLFGVVAIHPDSEPIVVGQFATEEEMCDEANKYQAAHPEARVFVRHNADTSKWEVGELGGITA
jgi:hypothetical protein